MTGPTPTNEEELEIAGLEAKLQERRFYFRIIIGWALVSAILTASFLWVVIAGFRSFPRPAQFWSLALFVLSFVGAILVLKSQKDSLFKLERQLKQWRVLRRIKYGTGALRDEQAVVRERYRAEAWNYVEEARQRATKNRRAHNSFQAVIIIGSILVTSLTSAMAPASPTNWIAVVVSILVSVSAGLSSFFKLRERGYNLQQTANAIEKEYNAVELRIRDYGMTMGTNEALQLFAERVEALKEEQRNRELQLEQSSEQTGPVGGIPNVTPTAG